MSRPVTPEYNIALQQFTNLSCTTTKHHKDSPEGRMKSDAADLGIRSVPNRSCAHRNLPYSSLRDIVNGVVTGEGVNVHDDEKQTHAQHIWTARIHTPVM